MSAHSGSGISIRRTAFTELPLYPPGWAKQFNGQSCDTRDWCAALTIDSLSEDPVNSTTLNPTCQGQILGGIEHVNFAFLPQSGTPIGPPNPLQFNPATSGAGQLPGGLAKLGIARGRDRGRACGGSRGRARAAAREA
jgi:hypothetical protein